MPPRRERVRAAPSPTATVETVPEDAATGEGGEILAVLSEDP